MFVFTVILIFIAPSMLLLLDVILFRKEIMDKILAANSFTTYTLLAIALLSTLPGRESYIDIAIIYSLLSFISLIGYMKFFNKKIPERNVDN